MTTIRTLWSARTTLTRTWLPQIAIVSLLLCVGKAAQAQPQIQIIPAPKQITVGEGAFAISRDTRVSLADSKSVDDRFAAQDFIDDVAATAELRLAIGRGNSRRQILIGGIRHPRIVQELQRISVDIPASLSDEGYVIVANPKQVIVAGKSAAGTFY